MSPKGFYENRPLPMAERYVDTFYPGVLESGGGYGFFYIMEGYWALGFFGVVALMCVYGWFLNSFFHWCKANITSDASCFDLWNFPLPTSDVCSPIGNDYLNEDDADGRRSSPLHHGSA